MLVYFECFKTVQITYAYLQKYWCAYLHFTYHNIYFCCIYNWTTHMCPPSHSYPDFLDIRAPFSVFLSSHCFSGPNLIAPSDSASNFICLISYFLLSTALRTLFLSSFELSISWTISFSSPNLSDISASSLIMVAAFLYKQDFPARNFSSHLSLYLSRISLISPFNLIRFALWSPLIFIFLVSLLVCSSWSDILTLPGSRLLLLRNYFWNVLNRRKRTVNISSK